MTRSAEAKFQDQRAWARRLEKDLNRIDHIFLLSGITTRIEERIKALAARTLKPGSAEPITDLDSLEAIWDLPGDRSYSSAQTEPFRPSALDYYVGRTVEHPVGTGSLVKILRAGKPDRYAIRLWVSCARCRKVRRIVYAQPGCHTGAFCYIYDRAGKYLADLRNQEFVCQRCQ